MRRFVIAMSLSSLALAGFAGCASSKTQKEQEAAERQDRKREMKKEEHRAEREQLEKRIEKLETQLEQERQLAERKEEIRARLEAELGDLVDAGKVELTTRRGMLVVQMPQRVLFASGVFELKNQGKNALKSVTSALGELEKHRILVAGHTDDVPVSEKSVDFANNWELSTKRALSAAMVLEASGVPPAKIGAAGYGSHDPIADNNSEKNRQRNRRIELVLVPNLTDVIQRARAEGDMQKNTAGKADDGRGNNASGSEG